MNQKQQLLKHMALEEHITNLQAIAVYRIYNIKGRINELRNDGWPIETTFHTDRTGKKYARYALPEIERGNAYAASCVRRAA